MSRRSAARGNSGPCIAQVGDVCIDLNPRTLVVAGEPVILTKEFEVPAVLARHRARR